MDTPKEPKVEIMIDLETSGKKAGCCVVSIGAVAMYAPFNTNKYFQCYIDIDSCTELGLESDIDTLNWWLEQDPEVRAVTFGGETSLKDALFDFSNYLAQFTNFSVWGNSASFDLKILEAAYIACKFPVPWTYKQEMCYRTVKNLFPNVKPLEENHRKHDALSDAVYQANHLNQIFAYIDAWESVVGG